MKGTVTYKVYRNRLVNATQMENEGCTTFSLFDYSLRGSTGRDDHETDLVGALSLDEGWDLGVSKTGDPLLVHSDETTVAIEGDFSEEISQLPKYPGIQYYKTAEAAEAAIDLASSDQWKRLERSYLNEYLNDFLDV